MVYTPYTNRIKQGLDLAALVYVTFGTGIQPRLGWCVGRVLDNQLPPGAVQCQH